MPVEAICTIFHSTIRPHGHSIQSFKNHRRKKYFFRRI